MKKDKQIRNILLAIVASISIYTGFIGLKYYNNIDNDIVKEKETKCLITPIRFNFTNIVDTIYNPETNSYYIKYDDPDIFDYDNLAYYSNMKEWYGTYIMCSIDSNIAIQFHSDNIDYNNTLDYYEKTKLNRKYVIIETESNGNISWELKSNDSLK